MNNLINALGRLNKDDKITVIGHNDFGFVQSSQTRFYDLEVKENYSQQFIYLIHKPKNKRKYYRKSLDNDVVILKGWHDVNVDSQFNTYNQDNMKVSESIYTSFDNSFLKDAALIYHDDCIYNNYEI